MQTRLSANQSVRTIFAIIVDIVTKYDGAVSAGDWENCSPCTLVSLMWSSCYPFPTDPDPRKWETVPAW